MIESPPSLMDRRWMAVGHARLQFDLVLLPIFRTVLGLRYLPSVRIHAKLVLIRPRSAYDCYCSRAGAVQNLETVVMKHLRRAVQHKPASRPCSCSKSCGILSNVSLYGASRGKIRICCWPLLGIVCIATV